MPLFDRDAAWLCRLVYAYPGDPAITWDHFDPGAEDGVAWAVKVDADGATNVVFPGTQTLRDAWRDIDFIPIAAPAPYAALEKVHEGFFRGLPQMVDELRARKPKRIRIQGHSYGAAHGRLVSRMLAILGCPSWAPVLFGEPASGFNPSPGRSYRNAGDPVPSLPPVMPHMPWTQGSPLIEVSAPPVAWDAWGPIAPHRIQYYCAALSACTTATD
ncbi:MAG: lipase family protein [Rhodomicrobium sp.]